MGGRGPSEAAVMYGVGWIVGIVFGLLSGAIIWGPL